MRNLLLCIHFIWLPLRWISVLHTWQRPSNRANKCPHPLQIEISFYVPLQNFIKQLSFPTATVHSFYRTLNIHEPILEVQCLLHLYVRVSYETAFYLARTLAIFDTFHTLAHSISFQPLAAKRKTPGVELELFHSFTSVVAGASDGLAALSEGRTHTIAWRKITGVAAALRIVCASTGIESLQCVNKYEKGWMCVECVLHKHIRFWEALQVHTGLCNIFSLAPVGIYW